MICLFFEWRLAVANRYCSSKGYGICAYPWVTFFFSGTYVSRWAGCRAAGGILVPYHAAGQILSAPAPGATEFYRPLTRTTTFLKTTWRFSGSNCSCGGWFMDVSGGLTYPLRYIEFFYSKTHYDYLNIIASIVSHRIDPFPMDLGGKHHPRPLPRNVPAVVQVPCGATGHRHQAALRLVHVVYGQLRRRKDAWRKRVLDEWWRQGQKP
jgi:hypothetical protein